MKRALLFLAAAALTGLSRAGGTPLSVEERDALAFLEYVTGPLPAAEEKDWWNIGGTQHGIFAKRYSIAFAGYAAAAIGMRGDAEATNRVGRILDNCVQRLLRRDVWAYSQSKSYWGGRKPWAPDPCYRENVMYTGHLLHLLAFYEWFTHDRKYWEAGFDFVWKPDQKVHYTVQKLIDVTVEQGDNLYTFSGYYKMAGNCLPDTVSSVPVGVQLAHSGEYTFALPDGSNGIGAVLVDKATDTRTNLGLTDYTVPLEAGTYNNRFSLELSPMSPTPTDVKEITGDGTLVEGARKVLMDGTLYIVRDGKVFDARGTRIQ